MKASVILMISALSLSAQDIDLNGRLASFKSLQGDSYRGVTLVKGEPDGLIWRDDKGGGGLICYTNLNAEWLVALGIPEQWIEQAKDRAQRKAVQGARYRAMLEAQARLQLKAQEEARAAQATNLVASSQSTSPPIPYYDYSYAPAFAYGNYGPAYSYPYAPVYPYYGPVYPPGLGSAPSAPSAASAPLVASAASAPSARSALSAPLAASAPSVPMARSQPSAPSAPSAFPTPGIPVQPRPHLGR